MLINNKQIEQIKVHAEENFITQLYVKKAKQFNAEQNIPGEQFRERIIMNYNTARKYGFKTKREVEIFIDYTFLYSHLNKQYPLSAEVHEILNEIDKSPADKLYAIKQLNIKK